MKPVVYHAAAEAEFIEALLHAEEERRGRGVRLDTLVRKAERQIQKFPRSGTKFGRGTRRIVLSRFPYSLIYLVGPDRFFVVAFAHAKRAPDYWRDRVA
jgi:plasmid stabilization system protein ParE